MGSLYDDMKKLFEKTFILNNKQKLVLVGHSYGCPVSQIIIVSVGVGVGVVSVGVGVGVVSVGVVSVGVGVVSVV